MAPRGRPTRLNPGTTPPPVTDPTTTTSVTSAQLQAMIDEGVTAVLAARATTRNGDDSHTSGTGVRRNERAVRECTYQDFMKCQPLFFRGTEGVVDLTQWFERMETVFRISNCTVENQVKFATCTLMGIALTWWNSHARTVTNEVAYAMTWSDLKKKMTTKYCPRNEIKKIEAELWNLKVKGTDVVAYNQRFQELALLCDRMFPEETDKIERYVGGMPDLIYSSVVASKPKTMQEAIEMATELMDRRNNTFAERQAENKRKFEDTPRNNQNQQPNKRQNTGRAYAAGNGDKKSYEGTKPLCPKCQLVKDAQWKKKGNGQVSGHMQLRVSAYKEVSLLEILQQEEEKTRRSKEDVERQNFNSLSEDFQAFKTVRTMGSSVIRKRKMDRSAVKFSGITKLKVEERYATRIDDYYDHFKGEYSTRRMTKPVESLKVRHSQDTTEIRVYSVDSAKVKAKTSETIRFRLERGRTVLCNGGIKYQFVGTLQVYAKQLALLDGLLFVKASSIRGKIEIRLALPGRREAIHNSSCWTQERHEFSGNVKSSGRISPNTSSPSSNGV
ncbi:reverse transcriptase domain-containing protein [Tanacetum coccineum]